MVEGMKKPSAGRGLETCVGVICTAHAHPASSLLAYLHPASPWLAFQHCVCGPCLTLVGVSALRMRILLPIAVVPGFFVKTFKQG